jgi:hypothetical protein
MLVPRFCTGIQCTENTTGLSNWLGTYLKRNDTLLGQSFPQYLLDDCEISAMFNGTEDDEWSIYFEWADINSTFVVNPFWAELWYDHEDENIHCLVRSCRLETQITHGPNEEQPYYRATPVKTLSDLANMLETYTWDDLTSN